MEESEMLDVLDEGLRSVSELVGWIKEGANRKDKVSPVFPVSQFSQDNFFPLYLFSSLFTIKLYKTTCTNATYNLQLWKEQKVTKKGSSREGGRSSTLAS
jgi:hypothetical protein